MGIVTTTTTVCTCDRCQKVLKSPPVSEVDIKLGGERDQEQTAKVRVLFERAWASEKQIICSTCASDILRMAANSLDHAERVRNAS